MEYLQVATQSEEEISAKALKLVEDAVAIYANSESTAEDLENADKMKTDALAFKERVASLNKLRETAIAMAEQDSVTEEKAKQFSKDEFRTLGEFLSAVAYSYQGPHPGLVYKEFEGEIASGFKQTGDGQVKREWQAKDLLEQAGASGGFLVPPEFLPTLLSTEWESNVVRQRSVIIPMRRRQINVPALDMTGTTVGEPHQYGGVVAEWTEEAAAKPEKEPEFRQLELVAHKLSIYTEASTELLADSAIGLEALLGRLFSGAIAWEEDWAFLRGTGAGQPRGVITAPGTFVQPRAVAGTIGIGDIANMLMHHHGANPVWHITRSAMATLIQLNGPAANPSYVFMPGNFTGNVPATLMGYPIYWTEKLPLIGTQGDILLADWGFYYIGDRQGTTVESSMHYRFRYNLVAWRADHRVDGQQMNSTPWTLTDGVTQISPFVVLGDVET